MSSKNVFTFCMVTKVAYLLALTRMILLAKVVIMKYCLGLDHASYALSIFGSFSLRLCTARRRDCLRPYLKTNRLSPMRAILFAVLATWVAGQELRDNDSVTTDPEVRPIGFSP